VAVKGGHAYHPGRQGRGWNLRLMPVEAARPRLLYRCFGRIVSAAATALMRLDRMLFRFANVPAGGGPFRVFGWLDTVDRGPGEAFFRRKAGAMPPAFFCALAATEVVLAGVRSTPILGGQDRHRQSHRRRQVGCQRQEGGEPAGQGTPEGVPLRPAHKKHGTRCPTMPGRAEIVCSGGMDGECVCQGHSQHCPRPVISAIHRVNSLPLSGCIR
jgi:hypothetical protein